MVELRRTVRFSINPSGKAAPGASANGFGGIPSVQGLGCHYEMDVLCRGNPNASTGYLIDIKQIDNVIRDSVVPTIEKACAEQPDSEPGELLPTLLAQASRALSEAADFDGALKSMCWRLSPYYCVEVNTQNPKTVLLRQRFDLAAAHRLHAPELSDEENRAIFGKCNNPNGHGHNYQIEPCIAVDLTGHAKQAFTLADLERLAQERLIEPFDHKHLNLDTPEFSDDGGLIPTVEHIAEVFYRVLAEGLAMEPKSARLVSITVWETDRTSCTYPA